MNREIALRRRVWTKLAGGAAFGAAAMYVLDPDRGKRRRAIVRDRADALVADTRHALRAATRDAAHRFGGMQVRVRRFLTNAPIPDDLQLIERVRARLGRVVAHPHAIQVGANRGRVTLSGPVLCHEVPRLLHAIGTVFGVSSVEDRLVAYDHADSISSLQGGTGEARAPSTRWVPAARLAAIAGGTILCLYGLRHRSLAGYALAAAGFALVCRGAMNEPLTASAHREPSRLAPTHDPVDATPSSAE